MRRVIEVEESVKVGIVEEIESGRLSQMQAAKAYGVSRTSIQKWLKQYGILREKTQVIKIVMDDQKAKIQELQSALSEAHMELRVYKKLIEVAKRDHGFDIKKKLGEEQLKSLKESLK